MVDLAAELDPEEPLELPQPAIDAAVTSSDSSEM
jgi:hypothetical protein